MKTTTQPKHTLESQRTTSKRDTETTLHHSATLNTETLPNLASTSGHSKTTTSNTLFPGAFSHRTRPTAAQAKDATSALKKNSWSSADLNYLHLTNVMNLCLLAATGTKPSCETTEPSFRTAYIRLTTLYISDGKNYSLYIPWWVGNHETGCRDQFVVQLSFSPTYI